MLFIFHRTQQSQLILGYFPPPQQDSEKMKRLWDAVKAQTDYTIAVSTLIHNTTIIITIIIMSEQFRQIFYDLSLLRSNEKGFTC